MQVSKPSKIEEGVEGSISFLSNPKYEPFVYTTKSSILLVHKDFEPVKPVKPTLIRVEDVYACFTVLLEKFSNEILQKRGISENAFVHHKARMGNNVSVGHFVTIEEGAIIGNDTTIYPNVFIGRNVELGNNVTLHPGVKIYHECVIGDNCIVHANAVLGSDGFGFVPEENGTLRKTPQIGNVVLESDVEVGANTVIDRATMGSTIIRKGVKLDNLIQIAHNVEIGEYTVIAAQTGIAGSTEIGRNCMIGGQVGIVGHIKIADGTKIQAQSGVNRSIKKEDTAIYGSPALGYTEFLRSYACFKNLPDMFKEIRALREEVASLKNGQGGLG